MSAKIDLLGQMFGAWLVTDRANNKGKSAAWLCRCICGTERVVRAMDLRSHGSLSCGCRARVNVAMGNKRRALNDDLAAINLLFRWYKRSAKERGLIFALSLEQFRTLTSSSCFYCGCAPHKVVMNPSGSSTYIYNGVDRKDNSIGYLPANCLPCCHVHNFMRRDLSIEQFIEACVQVAHNHKR